jgi:hypothetical protein
MSHGNTRLASLARTHAGRAVPRLAAIVENPYQPPGDRVAAARVLLELMRGRPARRSRPKAAPETLIRVVWADPTT